MFILGISCLIAAMQFTPQQERGKMQLSSPAFESNQSIPTKYSCQGEDVSPPLHIAEVPSGTKSLCLIMDDPDAPSGVFDHWIAWDIQPVNTITEGSSIGVKGRNGFGSIGYRGPCPPPGKEHHYHIKLYALNIASIELPEGASKRQVQEKIKGHILAEAELIGTFKK